MNTSMNVYDRFDEITIYTHVSTKLQTVLLQSSDYKLKHFVQNKDGPTQTGKEVCSHVVFNLSPIPIIASWFYLPFNPCALAAGMPLETCIVTLVSLCPFMTKPHIGIPDLALI